MLSPGPLLEEEEELSGLGFRAHCGSRLQTVGGRQDIWLSLGTHVLRPGQFWSVLDSRQRWVPTGWMGAQESRGYSRDPNIGCFWTGPRRGLTWGMLKGSGPQAGGAPPELAIPGAQEACPGNSRMCDCVTVCRCMCESVYMSVSDSGVCLGGLLSEHVSEGSRL